MIEEPTIGQIIYAVSTDSDETYTLNSVDVYAFGVDHLTQSRPTGLGRGKAIAHSSSDDYSMRSHWLDNCYATPDEAKTAAIAICDEEIAATQERLNYWVETRREIAAGKHTFTPYVPKPIVCDHPPTPMHLDARKTIPAYAFTGVTEMLGEYAKERDGK